MALKDNSSPFQNADRESLRITGGFAAAGSTALSGLSAGAGDIIKNVCYFGTVGTVRNITPASVSISNDRVVIAGSSTVSGSILTFWWKGDTQL